MPFQTIEQLAAVGKAFGDGLRLEILRALSTDSYGVLELCRIFDVRQSAMSHHLKVLAKSGLVVTRKEANSVFYSRALTQRHGEECAVVRALFQTLDRLPLPENLQQRIAGIHRDRAEQSLAFFARHSGAFRQHQELIAEHELYAGCVEELLTQLHLPSFGAVLELGPGEGEFLVPLARLFERVCGLDNSETMLAVAGEFVGSQALSNVELFCGELQDRQDFTGQFDCMVVNMVLHHMAKPASVFQQAVRVLKPEGSLLVSELCRHQQEWVRDSCGDQWLGFGPEELDEWAEVAGLSIGESRYLGLRNGFQVQVRRFFRPNTAL